MNENELTQRSRQRRPELTEEDIQQMIEQKKGRDKKCT